MVSKITVPTETLETSDTGVGFQTKINALFTATKNAITGFNNQIDALDLATVQADKAKVDADKAATTVLAPLLLVRKSKLDNPLVHLFKKNKLVDTLKGELSWTRDSGATYIDRYGKLQYSPSPYATNLLTYSEDFSNAAWSDIGSVAVTDNYSISPVGTLATRLQLTGASTLKQEVTSTGKVLLSFWVKANSESSNTFRLQVAGDAGSSSEAFTATSEWTRITKKVGDSSVGTAYGITRNVGDADVDILIWGAQLESGVEVANGYVKTEATSVSGSSYVGIDVARQEKEGWLLEGASTNKVSDSVTMTTSSISLTSAGTGLSPILTLDYGEDAARIQFDLGGGTSSNDYCDARINYDVDIGGTDTVSFDIKSTDGLSNYDVRADFNGNGGDRFSDNFAANSIINVTGEWQRVWLSLDSPDADTRKIKIRLRGTKGTSNTADIMVRYPQAEILPFASSFIPTYGSSATRAADLVSFNPEGNMPRVTDEFTIAITVSTFSEAYSRLYGMDVYSYFYARKEGNGNITNSNADMTIGGFPDSPASDKTSPITYVHSQSKDTIVSNVFSEGINSTRDRNYSFTVDGSYPNPTKFVIGNSGHTYSTSDAFFGHINDFRIYDLGFSNLEVLFLTGE